MATQRPDRVCGIHFFNPAPQMRLVEVVPPDHGQRRHDQDGDWRSPRPAARTPSRSSTGPDSSSTPCCSRTSTTPCGCYEHGTASSRTTSTRRCGGCNFPMGPLALLDLVGLDTSVAILDALYDEFRDPNYAAAPTLRRKVAAGHLGRKTGRGLLRSTDQAPIRPTCWVGWGRMPERRPVEPPATRWMLPHPDDADRDGIVGIGGDLEPGTLLAAYRRGLFPMPFGRRHWPGSRRTREPSSPSTGSASAVAAPQPAPLRGPPGHALRRRHGALRRPRRPGGWITPRS